MTLKNFRKSLAKKFAALVAPECVVNEYGTIVDKASYNKLKESRDFWIEHSKKCLIDSGNCLEQLNKSIDTANEFKNMCQKIMDSKTEVLTLYDKQKNILNKYISDYESLCRTTDSLIGELIILGKTENEISEMFDKELSYSDFLTDLNNTKNNG